MAEERGEEEGGYATGLNRAFRAILCSWNDSCYITKKKRKNSRNIHIHVRVYVYIKYVEASFSSIESIEFYEW